MAVLGFRFSKLSEILGTIYLSLENLKPSTTMFIDGAQYLTKLGKPKTQYSFPSSVRYWAPSINMAVLGFRFYKLNKILGTIYKHGCTGF
jgi:hypothetical protein